MSLSGAQIRDKFVSYFRDKRGHLHLPSASLIPDNPTLLLTSAGMVPFVPIFLGQKPPTDPPRVVTVQKVTRAGGKDSDIENIGRTARHHSFFEMLGNFSFGDYFKKEVIPWAWEFVTKELGLDANHLYATIFAGDEITPRDQEAFDIWHKTVGLPQERIIDMPRKDNFWGPPGPTGPCGPCTEIYYDRGPEFGCSDDPKVCGIGICECDRYLEFWNLVFMELFKDENGQYSPLMHKNVDTGSGLERVATIIQKKNNVYETDLLWPILEEVSQFCGVKYSGNSDNANDRYLKIITDHARCVSFLVADGIRTSNVGRGYVLRFIIRRAARFGRLLGLTEPFIYKLAPAVISIYGNAYPELREQSEAIVRVIREEEERFAKTIDRGLSYLEPLLATNEKVISGEEAFNLYATYGFPLELTQEIAQEQNKSIDMEGFQKAREEHEQRSAANKFNVIITGDESFGRILREYGETRFLGYKELEANSEIIGLVKDGKEVTHLEEGQVAEILLDKTPFYGESGGQVGDTGVISTNDAKLKVLDTKKHEGLHVHKVQAISGVVELKESVHASVDKDKRHATVLHHSAAHLFHSAIRHLFGKQVVQAGQQVSPDVMRFDFTLDRQPTQKEIRQVEALMNEWVRKNLPVKTQEMSINEAKATGAIAMFGEKYGDVVRVVNMGDVSLEFCGGTHVSNTGEIGPIRLVSEGSIASGVRRVEGLAGEVAWNFVNDQLAILQSISEKFKTKPQELGGYLEKLQVDSKQKDKELEQLRERQALEKAKTLAGASAQKIDLNGKSLKVGMVELPEHSANVISSVATNLTESEYDIFIAGNTSTLVACASGMAVDSGFNANELFQDLKSSSLISKGGGKPKQAQGGRTPDKPFEEIKAKASNYLQAKLVAKK